MKPLYLIACSNAKLDKPAKGRDLYQGQAFKFAMRAAQRAEADVIILSALHGVVLPHAQYAPYDQALCNMTTAERATWAEIVEAQLKMLGAYGREITVLAGKDYAAAVATFPNVRLPLKGQGIGQHLKTMKHLTT